MDYGLHLQRCCVFLHVSDHYIQLVFLLLFFIHLINSLLTTSIPPISFPLLIGYRDPHLKYMPADPSGWLVLCTASSWSCAFPYSSSACLTHLMVHTHLG